MFAIVVSSGLFAQNAVLKVPGGSGAIIDNSPGSSHLQVNGFSKFATSVDRAHSWLSFTNGSSYISSLSPAGLRSAVKKDGLKPGKISI